MYKCNSLIGFTNKPLIVPPLIFHGAFHLR